MMTKREDLISLLELHFDFMIKFNRTSFYPLKNTFLSFDIDELLKKYVINSSINDKFEIQDISSIKNIKSNSIFFLNKEIDISLKDYKSLLVITDIKKIYESVDVKNKLLIKDNSKVYNFLLYQIFIHDDSFEYKDDFNYKNGSYISKFSKIDSSAVIQKNCIIGRGVIIGKGSVIKDNVVIKNAIISENSIICENTTIGGTGFGFDLQNMGSYNILPQIGIVYIDNNVFIGSNCAIDRAKIDITYIGKNSMLDNLIHIAHNVNIGANSCIAAQTGISGSVNIGENLICGGQVGFAGHINIGKNVRIAAKSGVTKNIKDNSIIAGFPATDIKLWKKKIINERKNRYK